MLNDIKLKITNKQRTLNEQEELEFFTEGKSKIEDGRLYLSYEESDDFGPTGETTGLVIDEESVIMSRSPNEEGDKTVFVFEKGKRYNSTFVTPFGTIPVEILTKDIEKALDEKGKGVLKVDYDICLAGGPETGHNLKIEIK
jgi:uncharacterized beta-barrel protein YwiB (DUF1934 family)